MSIRILNGEAVNEKFLAKENELVLYRTLDIVHVSESRVRNMPNMVLFLFIHTKNASFGCCCCN